MEELIVKVNGEEYKVFVDETEEGKILVHLGTEVYEVETKKDIEPSAIEKLYRLHQKEKSGDGNEIIAPLPGIIYDIKVSEESKVKKGESLFVLMAMKMENDITAPCDCVVKEIKVKKNDNVKKGDVLAVIEY